MKLLLVTTTACVGVAVLTLQVAAQRHESPERYDQGWDQATTQRFYHEAQGSITLPTAFMKALRTQDGTPFLERPYMESFGFIYGSGPNRYPIGLADTDGVKTDGVKMMGLTCAGCHTGQLSYNGTTVRIDGGRSNLDLEKFFGAVRSNLYRTAADPGQRKRFLDEAIAAGYPADKASSGLDAEVARAKFVDNAAAKMTDSRTPGGPGVIDALTGIAFNVMTLGLYEAGNVKPAVAPTKFPPLWQIWHFDWVQYNPFAKQPMARNVGEAIGLGARLNIIDPHTGKLNPEATRWKSTLQIKNIFWMEEALTALQPPPWPRGFGPIDEAKAARGQTLFADNCARCHGVRHIAGTNEWAVRTIPLKVIWTDPNSTVEFARTTYNASKLGLGSNMSGYRGLAKVVQDLKIQAYKDENVPQSEWAKYDGWGRPAPVAAPCGLKARPLVGIWAAAPFLHNGTVPSIYDLLSDERPAKPIIGSTEYDPAKLGMAQKAGPLTVVIDTSLRGYSNQGHWWTDDLSRPGRLGRRFSEAEKYEIIEYLKSATYKNYPTSTVRQSDPLPCANEPDWAETFSVSRN